MDTKSPIRRICIATWELKGVTAGGVGVLVNNILRFYGEDRRNEVSILWYGQGRIDDRLFAEAHPDCTLFCADRWAEKNDACERKPSITYTVDSQRQSFMLMNALKSIEAEHGPFDFVEFPDFEGVALASLQEKNLGRAFQNTTIAVRIHSTEAVLRAPDHRRMNPANAVTADLERKALRDANLVVGHLRPVVDSVADFFAFDDAWRARVTVEHPPVFVDSTETSADAVFGEKTPIILSSKVQWFKRPSTFINGVVGFMSSHPDYKGDAFLLAHVVDGELRRHCQSLVPPEYGSRIKFLDSVQGPLREQLISKSVTVFPSAYESFCLAAYEASRLGALVVLNEANPAFGPDTPWRDGDNCVKFDGGSKALADALARMWQERASLRRAKVQLSPPEVPYWLIQGGPAAVGHAGPRPLLASAVVFSSDDYGDPIETIASLMLAEAVDLEIILVQELPSRVAGREEILSRLRQAPAFSSTNIRIVTLGFHGGEAALINLGIQECSRDLVVVARGGARLSASYLTDSLKALEASPDYDIVLCQSAVEAADPVQPGPPAIGEALSSASWQNLFGEFEMVARRSLLARVRFDEALDRFVDWDFHMRACMEGARYIVANDVGVRLDFAGSRPRSDFRGHFDNVLARHAAVFPGGRISLVSVYEGNTGEALGRHAQDRLFFKRPLSYYAQETTPWWKLALRRPFRLPRWLFLREFQRKGRKN